MVPAGGAKDPFVTVTERAGLAPQSQSCAGRRGVRKVLGRRTRPKKSNRRTVL